MKGSLNFFPKTIPEFITILLLLYLLFELIMVFIQTCGVCHPVGHLISIGFLVGTYFVLANSSFFKARITKHTYWRWIVLLIATGISILALICDFALAMKGITTKGGLI